MFTKSHGLDAIVSLIIVILISSCKDEPEDILTSFNIKIERSELILENAEKELFKGFQYDLNESDLIVTDDSIAILSIPTQPESGTENARTLTNFTDHRTIQVYSANNELLSSYVLSGTESLNQDYGTYTGTVRQSIPVSSSVDYIEIRYQDGNITNVDRSYSQIGSTDCGDNFGYVYDVLECTGQKFEDATCCIEEGLCYLTFYFCFPARVIDCVINDCN